ncbi:Gfo/Idh/MocA family oxidoreductase [Mesorhizobium sp. M3A.F.Ca.ET.080.04.2.1]|uniref:Gfo/Idh/MocA family protein n=1 Tax=Mesorhizobium sp. M3A.F.Ca.ET.080.04.2.1 TaxID=2493676 RepID=UPI000F76280A|nr:Gfo/Idh/MocA family oxidoreductase [Mesorhizobium sp. M3A.F.Ca.ET.080.04.2.1]AZO07953.1 Gfo/Idh/MocA family oxidoreductase [Mesorhizobium sp. M3A.F.Ca.ET.080.04.2.1]RWF17820.1 MAG: Gfo/Idh/MocA family oxidoreductase [Mesorhizobium sp.]
MKTLNAAVIGTGFMGKAHSVAMAVVPIIFEPSVGIDRTVIVDIDEAAVKKAQVQYGFREYATDWREVVNRPDIDVVVICTPNDSHAEIAIAAAKSGKHVMCEKPMALTSQDGEKMLAAAKQAGIVHQLAFNFRHSPALQMAHRLVEQGRIGKILAFRGYYLQDWSADPSTPLSWRFNKAKAGSGALGDIGSHIIDAARLLVGEFEAVTSVMKTFIPERPLPEGRFFGHKGAASAEKGTVDVDDTAITMVKFASGVHGTIEVTRNAYGHHNQMGFEINATRGTIAFDYQRLNELRVAFADDPADAFGFRTIYSGPNQPYGDKLWPVAGMGQGYIDVKSIEWYNFLQAIAENRPASPNFEDGVQIERIIDAIQASAKSAAWERVA